MNTRHLTLTHTTEGGATPAEESYRAAVWSLLYLRTLSNLLSVADGERAAEVLDLDVFFGLFGELCSLLTKAAMNSLDEVDSARRTAEERGGVK